MRHIRWLALVVIFVSGVVIWAGTVFASQDNISHAYNAESNISTGSIVSLDPQKTGYVELADSQNVKSLVGVAVTASSSLLAVNESSSTVQIATSGIVSTLVTTVNGNITTGTSIGISPFAGIGMKALPGTNIVGTAEAAFNSKSAGAVEKQVTANDGQTHQLWVGYVPINIAIGTSAVTEGGTKLNSLQKLVKSLTGRSISTVRIAISIAIASITIVLLVTFTHASIYGGLVSIGRNPLAKHAVFKVLFYITSLALMIVGLAALVIILLLT